MSHTPGPWKFGTSQSGWSYTIHISQSDDAPYTPNYSDVGYIIQTCAGESQSIQEANARLIAAAPDLLAAAIAAEKAVNILWVSHHANRSDAVLEQLGAAIAKATGETA